VTPSQSIIPPSFTAAGFVYAGTNPACGSATGKTNVFLNSTDYAAFTAGGNVLAAGMRFFRDLSGTTWDTATKPKGYDPVALVVWNCNSTGITVSVNC